MSRGRRIKDEQEQDGETKEMKKRVEDEEEVRGCFAVVDEDILKRKRNKERVRHLSKRKIRQRQKSRK